MKNLIIIGLLAVGAYYATRLDKRKYLTEYFRRVSPFMVQFLPLMSDDEINVVYDITTKYQAGAPVDPSLQGQYNAIASKYLIPTS